MVLDHFHISLSRRFLVCTSVYGASCPAFLHMCNFAELCLVACTLIQATWEITGAASDCIDTQVLYTIGCTLDFFSDGKLQELTPLLRLVLEVLTSLYSFAF